MKDNIAKLFESGNYAAVALAGEKEMWQTYAALGLVGKTKEAVQGLKHFQEQEAKFYLAVAFWIGEDDLKALRILKKIQTEHAQNLLRFIQKPRINVLFQGCWPPGRSIGKFNIETIQFDSPTHPVRPYLDSRIYYNPDSPPDFYICRMIEFNQIPPNLADLPCPIFGQTSDWDAYIQTVYPWLHIFDELVVNDQTEWEELSKLTQVPISTFPKLYWCQPSHSFNSSRDIDLYLSGMLFHPYLPDKAKTILQVLKIPKIKCVIVNGLLEREEYLWNLNRSKVHFSHVRHPGGLPTRALDALACGCTVVVQKESVLSLYAGEEHGVLTYDAEKGDLPEKITTILSQWHKFEKKATKGAQFVGSVFSHFSVNSQFLRFLTFLAAKPRGKRIQTKNPLHQKWVIANPNHHPHHVPSDYRKISAWRACTMELYKKEYHEKPSALLLNAMAREALFEFVSFESTFASELSNNKTKKEILEYIRTTHSAFLEKEIFSFYEAGFSQFPKSLVLGFNFCRVAFHFGNSKRVREALELARKIVTTPTDFWEIDPMEDVFSFDFLNRYFNYRSYFEAIASYFAQKTPVEKKLVDLILASLYHYLAVFLNNLEDSENAVKLDPDFPFYKFFYAKLLLGKGGSSERERAFSILLDLRENSLLFKEAQRLLKEAGYQDNHKPFSGFLDIKDTEAWLHGTLPTLFKEKLDTLEMLPSEICMGSSSDQILQHVFQGEL
jgi:hypothetical protein